MSIFEMEVAAVRADELLRKCFEDEDVTPDWVREPERYADDGALEHEAASVRKQEEARAEGDPPGLETMSGEGTLVVVVGSSLSEALLAIVLHNPKVVLLAHGKSEDGRLWVRKLRDVLKGRGFTIHPAPFDDADPVDAYHEIRNVLLKLPKPYVIDITGGRKSMSAAAFFLGTELEARCVYLHGTQLSYLGRPKPGSIVVRTLRSPADVLGLSRVKAVREAWKHHQWESVATGLDGLADNPLVSADDQEGYARAREHALRMRDWEEARYEEAGVVTDVSPAAKLLTAEWAALLTLGAIDRVLAVQRPDLALAYLADAWGWISRRPDVDARLRYLRYFALGDFCLEVWFRALVSPGRFSIENDASDKYSLSQCVTTGEPLEGMKVSLILLSESYIKNAPKEARKGKICPYLVGWTRPPNPTRHWHAGGARRLRNTCAHHLGHVTNEEVTAVQHAVKSLLLMASESMHALQESHPVVGEPTLPQRGVVASWFDTPDWPTFGDVSGT